MYQVLLVDDEPILQLGIRRMLEGAADYQICASARNGEEALQYLQAHPVDIVMTDLKMPVMDGITLIKELKRRQLPAPVIVLSNYSDFELVREALTEGASDYVLKLDLTAQTLLKHLDNPACAHFFWNCRPRTTISPTFRPGSGLRFWYSPCIFRMTRSSPAACGACCRTWNPCFARL